MNNELYKELECALKKLNIKIEKPSNSEKNTLVRSIEKKYIRGNPRAWWTSMQRQPKTYEQPDSQGHLKILQIAPKTHEDVWLIADEDNEEKIILGLPIELIPSVLEECYYFEYYITPKDLSWLLAENDHGDLLLIIDDNK